MTQTEIVLGVAMVIVVYQIWISVQLFRASQYDRRQRWFQLILIWVAPIFGAIVVQTMMRSDGRPPRRQELGYTEPGDNAS